MRGKAGQSYCLCLIALFFAPRALTRHPSLPLLSLIPVPLDPHDRLIHIVFVEEVKEIGPLIVEDLSEGFFHVDEGVSALCGIDSGVETRERQEHHGLVSPFGRLMCSYVGGCIFM